MTELSYCHYTQQPTTHWRVQFYSTEVAVVLLNHEARLNSLGWYDFIVLTSEDVLSALTKWHIDHFHELDPNLLHSLRHEIFSTSLFWACRIKSIEAWKTISGFQISSWVQLLWISTRYFFQLSCRNQKFFFAFDVCKNSCQWKQIIVSTSPPWCQTGGRNDCS